MKTVCALGVLLLISPLAAAQEEELTPYSVEEIERFLSVFKQTYKNKKQPEDDAVAVLADLMNAHKYITSREAKGEAAKEELSIRKKIVIMIAKGLKISRRELVTLECARALGDIRDRAGAKPLLSWMDRTVLDAKSPHPQWVEYGFMSMAMIGEQDNASMDLLLKYASGRHPDIGVANQAMRASYHWRALSGKNRKEIFQKILGYLQGRYSMWKGSDAKKRAQGEKEYRTVSDEGLKALSELSGTDKRFRNPMDAMDWWKANKRRKWDPYVGIDFRKKE